MKPGCFYTIVCSFIICSTIFFFTNCFRPVGKCTYGETPAETGIVKIKSVEKLRSGNSFKYRVSVEGFFRRDFIYDEVEFNSCFKSAGYTTGSELKGSVLSGGPCPPVYSLDICR